MISYKVKHSETVEKFQDIITVLTLSISKEEPIFSFERTRRTNLKA